MSAKLLVFVSTWQATYDNSSCVNLSVPGKHDLSKMQNGRPKAPVFCEVAPYQSAITRAMRSMTPGITALPSSSERWASLKPSV